MQFPCSRCGKRLRVPDHHANPRVRCPNCQNVFRPLEQKNLAGQPDQSSSRTGGPEAEPPPPARVERPLPRPTPAPQEKRFSHLIGIGLMLLVFVGPRIARVWNRADRRQAPEPVNVDIDREIRDVLNQHRKKQAEDEKKKQEERREKEALPLPE